MVVEAGTEASGVLMRRKVGKVHRELGRDDILIIWQGEEELIK